MCNHCQLPPQNLLGDCHSLDLEVNARQVESSHVDQFLNRGIVKEGHERRSLNVKEAEKIMRIL